MDNIKKIISPLFRGITEMELEQMNTAGYLRQKEYEKNEIIYHMDTKVDEIGILLTGSVNIINTDFLGNSTILSNISAGGVFAETYALVKEPLLVEVVTAENSQILFLNIRRIMEDSSCNQSDWYRKLLYGYDKGFDKDEQKTIILAKANMLIYMLGMIREPRYDTKICTTI